MKILQISNKSPWPPREGGPIAMNALIVGLQDSGHEVHVMTMSTPKFPVDKSRIPADYAKKTDFCCVDVNNKIRAGAALKNLFSKRSYNIERFISEDFKKVLCDKLKSTVYDAVILESLYVTPYIDCIREHSKARVLLRAHNVEHQIWERLATSCSNPLTKIYLKLLARRLLRYEKSVIPMLDGIAAITDRDAAFFKQYTIPEKIRVVPFGILPENYIFTPQNGHSISLCHIGSMDWMPNLEGIRWFLEKCWPGIHTVFPDLKCHLAGRNMPDWLLKGNFPNVEVSGEVEDAHSFMTNHPVMIVPLLSGSGVRVKIIEAMALGRTVITTHVGAEGIRYSDGENILIADSPIAFHEQIKFCIRDSARCATIGASARKVIEDNHNCSIATRAMLDLLASV